MRFSFRKQLASLAAGALLLGALSTSTAFAQLGVKASGQKQVTLSDKVGNNQFTWSSDAPLEKINGTAEGVTGAITFDPKNLTSLKGTISAKVGTMKTGNTTRDGHLKNAQWLDESKFPEITFSAKSVSDVKVTGNTATGKVTGDFALHGVTKSMTVPFKMTYIDANDETKKRAAGDLVMLQADFTLSLKDFNVTGSKGTVGSKVGETIAISAKLFGATN